MSAAPAARQWRPDGAALWLLALAAIPPAVVSWLFATYTVDVPFWDTWDWLGRHFGSDSSGALVRYWPLHEQHRVWLTLIVDRLLLEATSLNMTARAAAKLLAAGGLLAAFGVLAHRTSGSARTAGWIVAACSALTFSLTVWPVWIDPRLLSSYLSLALGAWGLVRLSSSTRIDRSFVVAILLVALASVSYSHGMVAWVAFAPLVPAGAGDRRRVVGWAGVALLLAVPYAWELARQPGAVGPLPDVADWLRFTLALIGGGLAPGRALGDDRLALAAGAGGLAIALWCAARASIGRDAPRRAALPWISAGAWALGIAAATAVGRAAGTRPAASLEPRYAAVSLVFWCALVGLTVVIGRRSAERPRGWLPREIVVLAIAAACGGALWVRASHEVVASSLFVELPARLALGRACLDQPDADRRCLVMLHPDPQAIEDLLPALAAHGARFVRGSGAAAATGRLGRLEFALGSEPPGLELARADVEAADPAATWAGLRVVGDRAWFPAISQHPPSRLHWVVSLPAARRLTLETGVLVAAPFLVRGDPGDGVLFRIEVRRGQALVARHEETVLPARDAAFVPIVLDVSRAGGLEVEIALETRGGTSPAATTRYDWAVWRYPEIVTGERSP